MSGIQTSRTSKAGLRNLLSRLVVKPSKLVNFAIVSLNIIDAKLNKMKWNNRTYKRLRFIIYWLLQLASMCWAAPIIFEYHPLLGPIGVLMASVISTVIVSTSAQRVLNSRKPDECDVFPLIGIGLLGLVMVPSTMYFSGFSSSIEDIFREHDFTICDLKLMLPLVVCLSELAFEIRYNLNFCYSSDDYELIVPSYRIIVLTVWLFFVPYWLLKWIFYSSGTNDFFVTMLRIVGMIACPIFIPLLAMLYYLMPPF